MSAALAREYFRCLPWIEEPLTRAGECDANHVLEQVMAGRAQLWPGEDCALVTQCILGPEGPSIHAWLGGGRMTGLLALQPGVEAFGRAMGMLWATIDGRKGWDRVFRSRGYVRHGELLRKVLA